MLALRGIKREILIPCTARFMLDDEKSLEHVFKARFIKLRKSEQRETLQELKSMRKDLRDHEKDGELDLMDFGERFEEYRDDMLRRFLVGWELTGEGGDSVAFTPENLEEVLQYQEYREALWEGLQRVQKGYEALKEKNS